MRDYQNIMWKYLSILFILFALVVGARIFYDSNHHQLMIDEKIKHLAIDIKKMFKSSEEALKEKYLMLSKQYMQNNSVSSLFQAKKHDELYKTLKSDYEAFKHIDKHLHVMHFTDTNNTTILRMHKASVYGDNLTTKRPMLAYVNKSLKQQNAFEVGKNGIVYRVIVPYYYNFEHIGILEFGINPSYFVDIINKHYEVKSQVLVKSKFLNNLTDKKDYPSLKEYSIISQSDLFKKLTPMIDLNKEHQVIEYNTQYYVIYTDLDLNNYQGKNVAKILIAQNITSYILKNTESLFLINIVTISILFLIFLFLYIVFTKYKNEIRKNIIKMNSLKERSKYLETKAHKDTLTNTFNKEYFNHFIVDFLRINRNGIVLFIDIDHFKLCNDTHGHLIGDKILIQFSKTIQEYLRSTDLFVRWGGEEFIILFEDISFDIAVKKSQSIRKLIEQTKFINDIPITISIGVTKIKDTDTQSSLLDRADSLLYKAKESGRNKVEFDI